MFQIKINGTEYSSASSNLVINGADLDSESSNRDEVGVIHRDRIRADVHSVPFSFENLPKGLAANIKTALSATIITMTYPDLDGNATKTGYVSALKRSCTAYFGDGPNDSFWTLEFTFVEQ